MTMRPGLTAKSSVIFDVRFATKILNQLIDIPSDDDIILPPRRGRVGPKTTDKQRSGQLFDNLVGWF